MKFAHILFAASMVLVAGKSFAEDYVCKVDGKADATVKTEKDCTAKHGKWEKKAH